VAGVFTLEWLANDGAWRSNYETRVCECMWATDYGSPNSAHGNFGAWPPVNCKQAVNLTVPKTVVKGAGSFYNYVSDEDTLFTDHVHYRHIYISNNASNRGNRLAFYAMNLEHAMSEANGEMQHAHNVDIYGLKKEGSVAILWIRDSEDINIFGEAGGYNALQSVSQQPADFRPYQSAYYRIERTSPFKLSIGMQGVYGLAAPTHALLPPLAKKPPHVLCSFPLTDDVLRAANFPQVDWPGLIRSLWAPWCGYHYSHTLVVLEADGWNRTLAAATSAGSLYMRGYPPPRQSTRRLPMQ